MLKRKFVSDSESEEYLNFKKIRMNTSGNVKNVSLDTLDEVINDRMTGRPSRQAAIKASAKLCETSSKEDEVIDLIDTITDDAISRNVPIIVKKSISSNLNLPKQYQRKLECCEREPYKIHETEPGKKDKKTKGSKVDKRLMYIDFNAGVFEGLKKNFVRVMKDDFGIILTETPTLQTFGAKEAEETVLLDLKIVVSGNEHEVKAKIYNTKCSMDVEAKGTSPENKFKHLGNFTVGEYFARKIIPEFVDNISLRLNIKMINEECRKLALKGLKEIDKSVNVCLVCAKESKDKNFLKCMECSRRIHQKCATKYLEEDDLEEVLNNPEVFCCDPCGYGSSKHVKSKSSDDDDISKTLENIDTLSIVLVKPLSKEGLPDNVSPQEKVTDSTDKEESNSIPSDEEVFSATNRNNPEAMPLAVEHVSERNEKTKCNKCDGLIHERHELQVQLSVSLAAFNDTKKNLEESGAALANNMAENDQLKIDIVKLEKEKVSEIDKVVAEKLQEIDSKVAENNQLKIDIVKLKQEKDNEITKVVAEKVQEMDRLKVEIDTLKKTAEDNLNVSTDNKVRRLKNICQKMENEKKKLIDDNEKEKGEIMKAKMKVEEALTTAIFENKKLIVKDDTYTGIFDCLKELLNRKSEFEKVIPEKISTSNPNDESARKELENPIEAANVTQPNNEPSMIYMCDQCDFQSRREHILTEHIQIDHCAPKRRTVYVCDICEYKCENQATFKKHCKDTHQVKKFNCDHCGTKLNSLSGLDNHIQMFHKRRPDYQCEHCDSKFSSLENVEKHMNYRHNIFPKRPATHQAQSKWSKTYSQSERSANGFCRYWNNSTCQFNETCKFLHEASPFCKFQQSCRNIKNCSFFHEKVQNQQGFQFREEEFPPYQNRPVRSQQ